MRHWLVLVLLAGLFVIGCGRDLAGTYHAEARLQEGKQEPEYPRYTLADVQAELQAEPRTMILKSDGRYEMRTGDFVEEGNWRVEGDALYLRVDTSNGRRVHPERQREGTLLLDPSGQIIEQMGYDIYCLELVYERE